MTPQKIKILKGSAIFFSLFVCIHFLLLFCFGFETFLCVFFVFSSLRSSSFGVLSLAHIYWRLENKLQFHLQRAVDLFSPSVARFSIRSFILLFSCFRRQNSITKSGKLINIFLHEQIEKWKTMEKKVNEWASWEWEQQEKLSLTNNTKTQMEY